MTTACAPWTCTICGNPASICDGIVGAYLCDSDDCLNAAYDRANGKPAAEVQPAETTPPRPSPKLPPYAGSRRRYAIAFNALTAALRAADRFVSLSEREHATTAILNALDTDTADGRMLPAGTETVEQFAARITTSDGKPAFPWPDPITRQGAEAMVKAHERERAYDPQWRGTAELVRRHQHTTPWTPVEETP